MLVAEAKVLVNDLSLYLDPSLFKVIGKIELFKFIRDFMYSIPKILFELDKTSSI